MSNVNYLLSLANSFELKVLRNECLHFLVVNFDKFSQSDEFRLLNEEQLKQLLESAYLHEKGQ